VLEPSILYNEIFDLAPSGINGDERIKIQGKCRVDPRAGKSRYRSILAAEDPHIGAPNQKLVHERFGFPIVVTSAPRGQAVIDDIPGYKHFGYLNRKLEGSNAVVSQESRHKRARVR
jgi:hypothetical protein